MGGAWSEPRAGVADGPSGGVARSDGELGAEAIEGRDAAPETDRHEPAGQMADLWRERAVDQPVADGEVDRRRRLRSSGAGSARHGRAAPGGR